MQLKDSMRCIRTELICAVLPLSLFALSVSAVPVAGVCDSDQPHTIIPEGNALDEIPHLLLDHVRAPTLSLESPADGSLFGDIRDIVTSPDDLEPYMHPRVVFGKRDWRDILTKYADQQNFNEPGTWSHYFRTYSLDRDLFYPIVSRLAELETSGLTSLYQARPYQRDSNAYEEYRMSLKPLADILQEMSGTQSASLFMCALWTGVAERSYTNFLPNQGTALCISATVTWARVLLAHRTFYCTAHSSRSEKYGAGEFVWDTQRPWTIHTDHLTAGLSLALTYDVLYGRMSATQQMTVRSAIALLVSDREVRMKHDIASSKPPTAKDIMHNVEHSARLYLSNLAIQGEDGFDQYATDVLNKHDSKGFNVLLHKQFGEWIRSFMHNCIYPDGSTADDSTAFFRSLNEGSLALVAFHRHEERILDTARFRNLIYYVSQITEPWQSGAVLGRVHINEDGCDNFPGLFSYMYPNGELPAMIWRQNYGVYHVKQTCRNHKGQTLIPQAIFGREQRDMFGAPEGFSAEAKTGFRLSHYSTRRGLLVARSSHSTHAGYLQFDARSNAFLTSLNSTGTGEFAFAAYHQLWIQDLPQTSRADSRFHSVMYIDGIAQRQKAPPAKVLRVIDTGIAVVGVADLTYSYNYFWKAKGKQTRSNGICEAFSGPGQACTDADENLTPVRLGWPEDDNAKDLGFDVRAGLNMQNDERFRISKSSTRDHKVRRMVRSVGLIRSETGEGEAVAVIMDYSDAGFGSRTFESYLTLSPTALVDDRLSRCVENSCQLHVRGVRGANLDIYVTATSTNLDYRVEHHSHSFKRLVLKSVGLSAEEVWLILHPHRSKKAHISVQREANGMSISVGKTSHRFEVDDKDHGLILRRISPMMPRELSPWRAHIVTTKGLIMDKGAMYSMTNMPMQTVFNFSAMSAFGAKNHDELRTCSRSTTITTHIAVYDCGRATEAYARYMSRSCILVSESDRTMMCSKGSNQSWWSGTLRPEKIYYVVVSGKAIQGVKPRLAVTHLRRGGRHSLRRDFLM